MRKIAGAITTFARPEYYRQAMDSLTKCKEVNTIDWYVFQDGWYGLPTKKFPRYESITKEMVDENTLVTHNSSLPILEHDIEYGNNGINYQMNKVFQLFDRGYDTLFIFEDDLIVSPYYIKLLKACSKQHRNISVTFHSVNRSKLKVNERNLQRLRPAKRPRFWGFYLTKEVWEKIKPAWYEFYNKGRPRFPYYDPIITRAIRKYTGGKYEPVISRSYNVGVEGTLTMCKQNWGERGLEDQREDFTFERDKTLSDFKLIR